MRYRLKKDCEFRGATGRMMKGSAGSVQEIKFREDELRLRADGSIEDNSPTIPDTTNKMLTQKDVARKAPLVEDPEEEIAGAKGAKKGR